MATKPLQVLTIDPPTELSFKGPFTDVVTSHIKLTNPSDTQVCFKVKTTAPKQYCVRPNSGLVPPKESVSVAVMLQPFDFNAEERNKHKFMVQSAFAPEEFQSLDTIWKNTPANEMMDSKLRVVFDMPTEPTSREQTSHQEIEKQEITVPAAPIAADKISVVRSQPVTATTVPVKPNTQNLETEFRRISDENKRNTHQLTQLEQENSQLRERLRKLEAASSAGIDSAIGEKAGASSAFVQLSKNDSFIRMLIVMVVAIFIGLLLGRSF